MNKYRVTLIQSKEVYVRAEDEMDAHEKGKLAALHDDVWGEWDVECVEETVHEIDREEP